jgi:hypothetical protein
MVLTPKLPPGRANRKALAYTADIQRLRASGYTFEAIRLALSDAGLVVSRTTLKREAAKGRVATRAVPQGQAPQPPSVQPTSGPASAPPLQQPAEAPLVLGSYVGDSRSGKEIVDAFMQGRITNPLMQERTTNEGRSD